MNMPSPMNKNSYRDHVAAVKTLLKQLQSMASAVEEVKIFYDHEQDGLLDTGISGNCTRRKRRHSSSYGVVTASSAITGKALGVEIMSKGCKESTVWRGKERSPEFQD